MGRCKFCDRSGVFFFVNNNELCNDCEGERQRILQYRMRMINDCMKIIENTKKVDTLINRFRFLIENVEVLLIYEKKGITTIDPEPSKLLTQLNLRKDTIFDELIEKETEEAFSKMAVTGTAKSKTNTLSKLLLAIVECKKEMSNTNHLEQLENSIRYRINDIQLSSYLEEAEKAEFKEQFKKALDKYYEALYFLKHDDIDDKFQEKQISQINNKIDFLKKMLTDGKTSGKKFKQEQTSIAEDRYIPDKTICDSCGASNRYENRYCSACGSKILFEKTL